MIAENPKNEKAPAVTTGDLYRQALEQAAAQGDYDLQAGLGRLAAWMQGEPPGVAEPGNRSAATADTEPGESRAARRLGQGNAEWEIPSWEDLVRMHSARVYRLAYRLTGNSYDAEDLTQEVFSRVFRSLSSYTPGTFDGWLHRITTNLFLDGARRRQRIRFEGLGAEVEQKLPGTGQTPAQAFDDRHFDGDVQAALKSLPPDYRAAVVLCDIEGFSYEEVAATLGVRIGTARSRVHRGRAQLRAALTRTDRTQPSSIRPDAIE